MTPLPMSPLTSPMTLTPTITVIVLFAALLHASWNALIKSGRDVLMDTALVAAGATTVAAPLLLFFAPPPLASWPYLLTSIVLHIGYYLTLVGTYRAGDMNLGYPLMRGIAPLLVALISVIIFHESLSPAMWLGIAGISGGIISLSLLAGNLHSGVRKVMLFAFANASLIAMYTMVDAAGVRQAGNAPNYVLWMSFLEGMPFAALVLWLRRRAFVAHARLHWRRGIIGGTFSMLAYGIALWAMTKAPTAAVASLRETSVIFAAFISAFLLKEKLSFARWLGAAMILGGIVALRQ
ncbi:DMT family transporter [Herbaspirillum sp. meg3]|uniref:DMT family transporter n=1 Tax=Herbaspirillum sp. meg3 TaxID=2025949 RepID=UPI001E3003E0|nr:DMT family transporter [Herbaspirillum sp. meg3]